MSENTKSPKPETLYAVANSAMLEEIDAYLELAKATKGFTQVDRTHLDSEVDRRILLGGIGSPLDPSTCSAEDAAGEWKRMQAVPFNVENAVSPGVYSRLRSKVEELLETMSIGTQKFTQFDPTYIHETPYLLPIYQRLLNIPSKSKLKDVVGSVSDNAISKPASERLAESLNRAKPGRSLGVMELKRAIEPTLEGIVRDLVGRVLLESVVANALDDRAVSYQRESEYTGIEGVVYKFRADFVLPDAEDPQVFIEVRKSSSRHASLYAKDKMFSAINWKGKNKKLIAILVTEGPWTEQTLKVMSRVFDYVIPLSKAPEVAEIVDAYVNGGDTSRLKLLIDFSITPT